MSLHRMRLNTLKGVGPKTAEKLQKLGLDSVQDLLFHLPLRYEDRTQLSSVARLFPGQYATLVVEVMNTRVQFGRRRSLLIQVKDQSGSLSLRLFQFSAAMQQRYTKGQRLQLYGEVRRGAGGLEMVHPETEFLSPTELPHLPDTLTPIYPTTEGVHQLTLSKLMEQALTFLHEDALPELLPEHLRLGHPPLVDALRLLHHPNTTERTDLILEGVHPAQRRLALEELLAYQVSMLQARQHIQQHHAMVVNSSQQLKQGLLQMLPFSPTGAQERVVAEIEADLTKGHPMLRLVQGDVGSGKTLVAALAALGVLEQGGQVTLMAPTELLAEQHAKSFAMWLHPLGIQVGLLTGRVKGKAREALLASIRSGNTQFVVGTHALFQADVHYQQLTLAIIDEQHRFGVNQRMALKEKGEQQGMQPHQLVMTATPIPRTLAMTAYADLETSIIDELPPGRSPITTVLLADQKREQLIERVRHQIHQEQRQVYWVCTLIEESDVLQCQAAEDTAAYLQEEMPDVRIGLVHGRMKPTEKEEVMQAFKAAELDLLVATTVIEVGVDVPNASLMVIENPERLGLAQLHQLRGRVGRGSVASFCVLLYKSPLSQQAQERLQILRDSQDGFVIAEKDLEIRGPGEVLGAKQTGIAQLKVADLVRDAELIPQVQDVAHKLYQDYPELVKQLIQRWLPDSERYIQV